MRCATAREAMSAAADGEAAGAELAALRRHLRGCSGCTAYAGEVRRLATAVGAAPVTGEPVDLARRVLVDWSGRLRAVDLRRAHLVVRLRIALACAALAHVALSVASMAVTGEAGHWAREAATVDLAVAVGVLVAACRPWYAAGLLPVVVVLAGGFGLTAAVDLAAGTVTPLAEAAHLSAAVEVALLWRLVRHQRRALPLEPAQAAPL
jgi:predicted anti-sigma-YlaC factor YlaD